MFDSLERRPLDGSGEEDRHQADLAESANRSLEIGPNNRSSPLGNALNILC